MPRCPVAQGGQANAAVSSRAFEIIHLRSAIPAQSTTTAGPTTYDSVTMIITALQQLLPNLKIVQLPLPGTIGIMGDTATVRLAHQYSANLMLWLHL